MYFSLNKVDAVLEVMSFTDSFLTYLFSHHMHSSNRYNAKETNGNCGSASISAYCLFINAGICELNSTSEHYMTAVTSSTRVNLAPTVKHIMVKKGQQLLGL